MQERTSNRKRTETTTAALISAARGLFVEKGFAETSTPEVVKAAKVTRGALYHHFADKTDLFRAVVQTEAAAVATHIAGGPMSEQSPAEAMQDGARRYFEAMAVAGRTHLLLIDGPAVLGRTEMDTIDQETGAAELKAGLQALSDAGRPFPTDAMAAMLSAAFDRAALEISTGAPSEPFLAALDRLIESLLPS